MYYKQEKIRQMLRSVLPSSARKGARDNKSASCRRNRRNVKVALRTWKDELHLDDDAQDYRDADDSRLAMKIHVSDRNKARDTRYAMQRRRDSDKISHFVRWATHLTRHLDDIQDKYFHFVGHIGGSGDLIREHAIGHFISPYEFNQVSGYDYRDYGKVIATVARNDFADGLSRVCRSRSLFKGLNIELRESGARWSKCKDKDPCVTLETVHPEARISHYILEDGQKRYSFLITPEERRIIARTVYQARPSPYTRRDHDRDVCPNAVQLEREANIPDLIRYLYPRNKFAWGFTKRGYNNRPRQKRLAWTLWRWMEKRGINIVKAEDDVAERGGDDGRADS